MDVCRESVQSGKGRTNEISDVHRVLNFFNKVLENKGTWVKDLIKRLIKGKTDLIDTETGKDAFAPEEPERIFPYLRGKNMSTDFIINGIYEKVVGITRKKKIKIKEFPPFIEI